MSPNKQPSFYLHVSMSVSYFLITSLLIYVNTFIDSCTTQGENADFSVVECIIDSHIGY